MGAHLAHGQHHVTGADFGIFRIAQPELPAFCRIGKQSADTDAKRRVGDFSKRRGDTGDRPNSANIGKRDQQRCLSLHPAKNLHDTRGCPRRRPRSLRRFHQSGEFFFGAIRQKTQQACGIRTNEVPKVRRTTSDPGEQHGKPRVRRNQRLQGLAGRNSGYARYPLGAAIAAFGGGARQRSGEPPDQCAILNFADWALPGFCRPHQPPAGPARGKAMILFKPGSLSSSLSSPP